MINRFIWIFVTIPILFYILISPAQSEGYGRSELAKQMGGRIVNSGVFTVNELNSLLDLSVNMESSNKRSFNIDSKRYEYHKAKPLEGRAATSSDRSIGRGYVCFDCGDGYSTVSCTVKNTSVSTIERVIDKVLSPDLNQRKFTVKYQNSIINYYASRDTAKYNRGKKYRVLSKVGITNGGAGGIHFLMANLPYQLRRGDVAGQLDDRYGKLWDKHLINRTKQVLRQRGLSWNCD